MKLSRKLSEKELAEYKVKILTRVSDIKDRKMIILRSRNNYTCINAETFSRFFSAFKMAVQRFCWSPSGRISWKSSQCVRNMTDRSKSYKIVPNKKGKASIWQHFGFVKENNLVDKTRVACKLWPDQVILKYNGNTTNLTDHVQRKHSRYLQSTSSECSDATASIQQTTHSGQEALLVLFATRLPHNSSRVNSIFGAILQFIIKDLRPFSVVQNSGFQTAVHILEPRYTIPSRQHFSDKALLELYEQKKTELNSELADAIAVALTTDGWTSHATESYLTITCHYIDKEWSWEVTS